MSATTAARGDLPYPEACIISHASVYLFAFHCTRSGRSSGASTSRHHSERHHGKYAATPEAAITIQRWVHLDCHVRPQYLFLIRHPWGLHGPILPIHSLRATLRNRYRLLKAVHRGGTGSAASDFSRRSADRWNPLLRLQRSDGGRNRDRTYDLCDVNVRLTGLEIELRSRVWRSTSILPQQQLFGSLEAVVGALEDVENDRGSREILAAPCPDDQPDWLDTE